MATQRISFDFDADEYKYLKMCCAKSGLKIREFISRAIINAVEAKEDEWLIEQIKTEPGLQGDNFVYIDHNGVKKEKNAE